MRAIILAGGLGTRLRPIIGEDTPKCMAPVIGRPMIVMVVNSLKKHGITDITLSLCYKAEKFVEYFGDKLNYVIEETPLGTGGAIENCLDEDETALVLNGDTITTIDYNDMIRAHRRETYPLTIAKTPDGKSAGVYVVEHQIFNHIAGSYPLSFENDVIPKTPFNVYPVSWFTDFGTPESYTKAPKDWV